MESHFVEMFSSVSIVDVLAVFIVLVALIKILYAMVENIHKYKTAAEKRDEMTAQHDKDISEIHGTLAEMSKSIELLSKEMTNINDTLIEMKSQTDYTEMIKYQDRIVSLYKHYKKLGYWNELERTSFNNMYNDYVARGGNSFVKETIKPFMETLTVKTMTQVEIEELHEA